MISAVIHPYVNSMFASKSYLVNSRALVDVGDYHNEYASVNSVLLTHCHFDHIYGLNNLLDHTNGINVYTNECGKRMLLDEKLNLSKYNGSPFAFSRPDCIRVIQDGEEVCIGKEVYAKAVFTPGHCPSCVTWIIADAVFTGDSYIPGLKTVTNLPHGNKLLARQSEKLIQEISQGRAIYPGHKI